MGYVVAMDIGTTSSRAIAFDHEQNIVGVRQQEVEQIFPQAGWVEQDPMGLWASSFGVLQELLAVKNIPPTDIRAIGIANQRETTIVWEKATGKPVYNAIVWQCRRTADVCEKLKADGWEARILEKTGLVIDAYFSATKLAWILDRVDPDRSRARAGELLFGTVDTWILWKLTEGRVHATDYTNASRTMLYNINSLEWDQDILDALNIPRCMLPEVRPSGSQFGVASIGSVHAEVPIAGIAGDQQAALYGQMCWEKGEAKNTYGTGCFLLMNIGKEAKKSGHGLVTTIAAGHDVQPDYALEGSIFVGGAVIQWLRDEMRFIEESSDSAFFAEKLQSNDGVYLVPAFVGLGAPYWDMYARGTISGLTRGSGRSHIIRAALEAIAYQTRDVLEAMVADTKVDMASLRVDGGASQNQFLMQFQADILDRRVELPQVVESTALGAAILAGLTVGFWKDVDEARAYHRLAHVYEPQMDTDTRQKNYDGWKNAVAHTLSSK
ncbi:MAG: glycerol kinase GlpK [Peptococcaceae bacterium]|nr:glycerol kinase GlpK [Peptococcaceae bacterium]